jgi:hypothetical protein
MTSRSPQYQRKATNPLSPFFGTTVAMPVAKRRTLMLRITIHDRAPMTSFVLEGKLVGPWVKELKQCWQDAVAVDPSTPVLVDLASVTFVDHEGRALLKQMRHQGVRLSSHGVLIDAIVADIEAEETKREQIVSGC